jgi:hypothetical protein
MSQNDQTPDAGFIELLARLIARRHVERHRIASSSEPAVTDESRRARNCETNVKVRSEIDERLRKPAQTDR